VARMRSLAMVGEMAAGAAHELNNPLAVISGRAQLLSRDDVSEEVNRSAALISEHAHRASAIVSELMDFAKPAPPQPVAWSPAAFLSRLRAEWIEKGGIAESAFELALSDDVADVLADASQSRMLFDALISNAVDAMREVSAPRLVVNCVPDLTDDRVVIRIQDNGCGMTPDVMERAMDPFFSYRNAGRGRGLGLSRAARYAEINGGRIRLASVPGEGTCVFVELPIAS
jgi:signal transduction histidine kinase